MTIKNREFYMVSKAIAAVLVFREIYGWSNGLTGLLITLVLLLSLLLLPLLAVAACVRCMFIK